MKNTFLNNNIKVKTTTTTVIKCESKYSPCQMVIPVYRAKPGGITFNMH